MKNEIKKIKNKRNNKNIKKGFKIKNQIEKIEAKITNKNIRN